MQLSFSHYHRLLSPAYPKSYANLSADPIMFTVTEEVVQGILVLGGEGTINFSTEAGYNMERVLKDGIVLALDGTDTPEIQYSMNTGGGVTTHTLTIPTVTKESEGIYQFEAESSTGRIVEYHHVAMKCKFIMISV